MTTADQLRDLDHRPQRYWNIDGIPELVMGLVWMLWGAALIVGDALPRGAAAGLYWIVVPAILVLSGFAANWVVRRLKQRVTYPRTGYIAYRDPGPRARLATGAVVIAAAATIAAIVVTGRAAGMEHSVGPVLGVIISLAFVVASLRQKAPHLLSLAGVALALGIAFGTLKMGWAAVNWLFVWLGLAAATMGAWRLRRYLRQHPLESRP